MNKKVSVVINTFNEEKNIARAIKSVLWADEILVCDMSSEDKTMEIAKKMGAKIVFHKKVGFVEPARNFAISKASFDWILILDADEEIPQALSNKLQELVKKTLSAEFVQISRKNIIFNHWMKASNWWPDYQIRFFKKGAVRWQDHIHSQPKTSGNGLTLPAEEQWAIIHHNYQTVGQFIERMNRYTDIQADQLKEQGYKFDWKDLLDKSFNEFLSRFFANKGYEDGLHGLALSLLQAFSFIVTYLKVWEMEKFSTKEINLASLKELKKEKSSQLDYWLNFRSSNPFKRFLLKIKNHS